MGPPGLWPWAPKVLSGTGWRLPDGFRAFGPGSYIVPLRWRGTAPTAPVYMPPAGGEAALPQSGIQNSARRAPTSPAQRCFITPEGASPEPACKAKPITGRTLAAQGQRPGGWLNPHARKGVSTFGNTGKHRPGPIPHPPKFQIPIHLKKEGKFYASKNSTQNH